MSLLLEACLSYAFGPEQIAVGFAGLIKLGDIVSDVFFILDLKEWKDLFEHSYLFDGKEKMNLELYLIAAGVFTAIGIVFDLAMSYIVIKDRRERKTVTAQIKRSYKDFMGMFFDAEEGGGDTWIWWKHANLFIEEVPQLVILLCFFMEYYRGCEQCSDEQKIYMYKLYISAIVSAVFTAITVLRVSVGGYRSWRKKRARKKRGILPTLFPLSSPESSSSTSWLPQATTKDKNTTAKGKNIRNNGNIMNPLREMKKVTSVLEDQANSTIKKTKEKETSHGVNNTTTPPEIPGLSSWFGRPRQSDVNAINGDNRDKRKRFNPITEMKDAKKKLEEQIRVTVKKADVESLRKGQKLQHGASSDLTSKGGTRKEAQPSSSTTSCQSLESRGKTNSDNSFMESNVIVERKPYWGCFVLDDLREAMFFSQTPAR